MFSNWCHPALFPSIYFLRVPRANLMKKLVRLGKPISLGTKGGGTIGEAGDSMTNLIHFQKGCSGINKRSVLPIPFSMLRPPTPPPLPTPALQAIHDLNGERSKGRSRAGTEPFTAWPQRPSHHTRGQSGLYLPLSASPISLIYEDVN